MSNPDYLFLFNLLNESTMFALVHAFILHIGYYRKIRQHNKQSRTGVLGD